MNGHVTQPARQRGLDADRLLLWEGIIVFTTVSERRAARIIRGQQGRADGVQIPERNCQAIAERDQTRRQRAEALIEAGALPAAAHIYHAAMLVQHGDNVRDYWRGHELAKQAAELGTAVALAGGRSLRVSAGIRVGQ